MLSKKMKLLFTFTLGGLSTINTSIWLFPRHFPMHISMQLSYMPIFLP